MTNPTVYFYPHAYLRDRHLDTIRHWPKTRVLNPELATQRKGGQVSKEAALSKRGIFSWKNVFPLPNIKIRPRGVPVGTPVYIWGGVIFPGSFILELDNPFALTGYHLRAMTLYRPLLKKVLENHCCLEIRCISGACRETLRYLFGDSVYKKSQVIYPFIRRKIDFVPSEPTRGPRFLFVGSQFEIKGGVSLLRAFQRLYAKDPEIHLDMVTYLPDHCRQLVEGCPGIRVFEPGMPRDTLYREILSRADVLVHPTYVESFGMVVLEALAYGLGIIATDVYALGEMVRDGENGFLLNPPVSIWEGVRPSRYYYKLSGIKQVIRETDTRGFEDSLFEKMELFSRDSEFRTKARRESLKLLEEKFLPKGMHD